MIEEALDMCYYKSALFLMILLVCANCQDEIIPANLPPTNGLAVGGVEIENVVGLWNAEGLNIELVQSPNMVHQVVKSGGLVTLEIANDGRFVLIVLDYTWSEVMTGEFSVDRGVFTAVFDHDPEAINAWIPVLSGNQLVLHGPASIDFESNGIAEPVLMKLTLRRQ